MHLTALDRGHQDRLLVESKRLRRRGSRRTHQPERNFDDADLPVQFPGPLKDRISSGPRRNGADLEEGFDIKRLRDGITRAQLLKQPCKRRSGHADAESALTSYQAMLLGQQGSLALQVVLIRGQPNDRPSLEDLTVPATGRHVDSVKATLLKQWCEHILFNLGLKLENITVQRLAGASSRSGPMGGRTGFGHPWP